MIPPIEPIRAAADVAFNRVERPAAPGFQEGLGNALQCFDTERHADATTDIATEGPRASTT